MIIITTETQYKVEAILSVTVILSLHCMDLRTHSGSKGVPVSCGCINGVEGQWGTWGTATTHQTHTPGQLLQDPHNLHMIQSKELLAIYL